MAICGIVLFKAPGPNGFEAYFYQTNWVVFGNQVFNLVRSVFDGEAFGDHSMGHLLFSSELPESRDDKSLETDQFT